MFVNSQGRCRLDPEKFIEQALSQSPEQISRHEELQGILKDGLNSFEARLADLTNEDRKAVECLIYQEFAELVFDFRLSLETRFARQRIANARTRSEKLVAVENFRSIMADVEMIHGK